jgi:tRNA(Ser,Leu) C12 N-acetylase TAN1
MRFLLTTDEGIEDVVVDEIRELCPAANPRPDPSGFPGRVLADGIPIESLLDLTTIQHVVEIRGETEAVTLDQVERAIAQIEVAEMAQAASFRVTSERRGKHDFGHMEIQRVAGGVLHDRYGTPVDLEGYELNVRVDLYGKRLVVGVQRTRESLAKRIKRDSRRGETNQPKSGGVRHRLGRADRRDRPGHRGQPRSRHRGTAV